VVHDHQLGQAWNKEITEIIWDGETISPALIPDP
jgi:hypothetical protein